MEQGIANAGSAMIVTTANDVMDRTAREINDALASGTPVYLSYVYGVHGVDYQGYTYLCPITFVYTYGNGTAVRVVIDRSVWRGDISGLNLTFKPGILIYAADNFDGYPSFYGQVTVGNSYTTTS